MAVLDRSGLFRACSRLFWGVPGTSGGYKYGFMVFQEVVNILVSRFRVFQLCLRPVLSCSGPFRILVCTHLEFQIVPGCPKISFSFQVVPGEPKHISRLFRSFILTYQSRFRPFWAVPDLFRSVLGGSGGFRG